jgi:glutathione S-transferase
MKPKLISFKLCPFVQRSVIALLYKQVEYDIDYIDLADPPAWFVKLSPLKKVPLLLIGDQVIFESAVIDEYIDEAYPRRLHPADLVQRAQNRSWIEFGNTCMGSAFDLSVKREQAEFDAARAQLAERFDQLETAISGTPYFNGADFSLVDVSYAPLFQRLAYLDELSPGILDANRHPKIDAWQRQLLQLDAVQRSTVPEIKTLYLNMLHKRQGYIARFLDPQAHGEAPSEQSVY